MPDDALPLPALPEGSVLVHIGMHKTGTTAMQTLFGARRPALLECGVLYPGPRVDHHVAARSFTQRAAGPGGADKAPPPRLWAELVASLAGETRRTVLSSEFFSSADADESARLVQDLGRDRTHILVGVRNTSDSAVSTWQQTLKEGRSADIDRWARTVLPVGGRPPKSLAYWRHWDLGAMVRRWADAAGADHVTVVVVDRQDRRRLPTAFEELLGLEPGFLADHEPPLSNRGMTAREAEFIRQLNVALREKLDWPAYRRIMRRGVIRSLVETRAADRDEPRPALPAWALEVTRSAGEKAAAEIRASGVQVVGDLAALSAERPPAERPAAEPALPIDVAVLAAAAAIEATREPRTRPIAEIPTRELAEVLGRRLRRIAKRRVRALRTRG